MTTEQLAKILTCLTMDEGPNAGAYTHGPCIVVADRGFVYSGLVTQEGDWIIVREAKNVRVWGTTNGLGELALRGVTPKTVLDPVGTVKIPLRGVLHLIPCKAEL